MIIINLLLNFLILSCNQNNKPIDYIIFGHYAGECVGNCCTMFKLESNKLLYDSTTKYFGSAMFKFDVLMNKNDFLKAQVLKNKLPKFLSHASSQTYGLPDYYDQGAYYLEIKRGNAITKFQIDSNLKVLPEVIRDYIKLINNFFAYVWK